MMLVPVTDQESLDRVRVTVVAAARAELGLADEGDPVAFMNDFHRRGLSAVEMNSFRLALIRRINDEADIGRLIWQAFRDPLTCIIGPDVVVQKSANLVIHLPEDGNNAPIHRDAPPNSPFEVVVWVPLVDCFGTKGMCILDKNQSREGMDLLQASPETPERIENFVWDRFQPIPVPYGSAVMFWAGLLHAVPTNTEGQTRWSFNIRYKNTFAPYGTKGYPEYFKILEMSPLTELAYDWQRPKK
ncbi:hypothetical protein A6A05_04435 [Magnetospirillum moscoviense]|uniref:Fe2OG dioxygenase domain-containing protein n=2 Tax=Magnetospirillum moscoviense TaxID=1437059 RepID=A0A178MA17_9PROT|nr:hypothetical protein A6A05_04435 [Magnetospirillum moscoviense]